MKGLSFRRMLYAVTDSLVLSTLVSVLAFFVMSEAATVPPIDDGKVGPDYFGFYKCEVVELLSQGDDDSLPSTSQSSELSTRKCVEVKSKAVNEKSNGFTSLFGDCIGGGLSNYKRERLKSLLKQCAVDLSGEVDEMLDPVISMCQLKTLFRNKKYLSNDTGTATADDAGRGPCKKLKGSSSSSGSIPVNGSPLDYESCKEGSGKGILNGTNCVSCQSKETSEWINDSEGAKEDLLFLLKNDSRQVEEMIQKYSDELLTKLGSMEQQLEELLDAVVSKCRPLSLHEKHKLQMLIQRLPPNNLDRVVELIQRGKPAEKHSPREVFVDLEQQDNLTLWRLYNYVQAVEKAKGLSF